MLTDEHRTEAAELHKKRFGASVIAISDEYADSEVVCTCDTLENFKAIYGGRDQASTDRVHYYSNAQAKNGDRRVNLTVVDFGEYRAVIAL